jgi:2-polyprenyl-3-methyl-5-hydroxy-6-metoxy-1,4-benzoquinol methylase
MRNFRSYEPELIDLGLYSKAEYEDCLFKLDRVGRWLGGDHATFKALKNMDHPLSILDVGCGGGLFTIRLAQQYPHAKVVGIDLNPHAIEFAQQQLSLMPNPPKNICFEHRTQPKLEEPNKSYDVLISTLVCHHLDDHNLIDFIHRACRTAKKGVILNDLHRHPIASLLFKIVSPLFFRNRLVLHDGPLSIDRAFARSDWIYYLDRAQLTPSQYSIHWRWAFRWLVEINCKRIP